MIKSNRGRKWLTRWSFIGTVWFRVPVSR